MSPPGLAFGRGAPAWELIWELAWELAWELRAGLVVFNSRSSCEPAESLELLLTGECAGCCD